VSRTQGEHPLLARELECGKALVIPNGVDVDHVRAEAGRGCDHPWASDRSVPMVLAVGRHVAQKNFPALLAAFALARASRPMRLMFIGDGGAQEIQRMRQTAMKLGIDRDVAFLPAVRNPFPYMAAAHAFVLPSWWEGSANVLLEAMACGTPVIAARTAGDAQQVLGHGRYGVLVEPNAIQQLADAILEQTGPNAVRPGARAADFDRSISMHRYVQLFDMLIERKAERPVDRRRDRFKPFRALPSSRSAAAGARRRSFPA
jgi:glycosyltransferase involved in cell wall biosynthesis